MDTDRLSPAGAHEERRVSFECDMLRDGGLERGRTASALRRLTEKEVETRASWLRKHKLQACCVFAVSILWTLLVLLFVLYVLVDASQGVKHDPSLSRFRGHNASYQQALVNRINSQNRSWKAEFNPSAWAMPPPAKSNYVRPWKKLTQLEQDNLQRAYDYLSGKLALELIAQLSQEHIDEFVRQKLDQTTPIPANFDAREKWPNCWTVSHISDQGSCGSCFAAATAGLISDRICVASGGRQQPQIAVEHILNCCQVCQDFSLPDGGCQGSYMERGLYEWTQRGLVSGGDYGTSAGCLPYTHHADCGHPCSSQSFSSAKECKRECHPSYGKTFKEDLHFGKYSVFDTRLGVNLGPTDTRMLKKIFDRANVSWSDESRETLEQRFLGNGIEEFLMREMVESGPIGICFPEVLEDFQHYKSGVYTPVAGDVLYNHCMKVVGYGTEAGRPYWLVANSFGRNWGEFGWLAPRTLFWTKGFGKVDRKAYANIGFAFGYPLIE